MKKNLLLALVAILGVSDFALADSVYKGPFFTRHSGDKRDFSYSICQIMEDSVNTQYYVDGHKVEASRKFDLEKSLPKWRHSLEQANKQKSEIHQYIKEQRPTAEVAGFLEQGKKKVVLFSDGGHQETRLGDDAKDLRAFVAHVCGTEILPIKK